MARHLVIAILSLVAVPAVADIIWLSPTQRAIEDDGEVDHLLTRVEDPERLLPPSIAEEIERRHLSGGWGWQPAEERLF